ncbi:putative diphthamide synthesis protein-domain-containing protein [Fomitopsis serialis]|uniref:putative diphthamide synthesis protein-domain-containing protein n=1 Tax=Fomitopsis serialis TaxID=139415 RepID=UPI002007CA6E|nr:putative diphthamide synthesis protein-domain-containing protein [Neoantrodia serialis]KAH9938244.1 putative diphthamide synthesis protein-domain-containing protein [Neoantrodia serialis]
MGESTPVPKPSGSKNATKPRKRFVGSKSATPSKPGVSPGIATQIPQDILNDLPTNYSFEIHKTIHHVRKNNAKMVALQMPEGLQMFACTIADIIERFTDALTVIMGDVTYGACCIDDYTAVALGCDMLVHYGHSCLDLYIFVEIAIDSSHLIQTLRLNFPTDRRRFHEALLDSEETDRQIPAGRPLTQNNHLRIEESHPGSSMIPQESTRLALVSTIQFVAALSQLKDDLTTEYAEESPSDGTVLRWDDQSMDRKIRRIIPRSKPLLNDVDALMYLLGDGRFHLESIMIANPSVRPSDTTPIQEVHSRTVHHTEMRTYGTKLSSSAAQHTSLRLSGHASRHAPRSVEPPYGGRLGTLGRQGSFKQLQAITHQLSSSRTQIPYMPILLSELHPRSLPSSPPTFHLCADVLSTLSIDWGYDEKREGGIYPMDFYAAGSPWAVARTKATY